MPHRRCWSLHSDRGHRRKGLQGGVIYRVTCGFNDLHGGGNDIDHGIIGIRDGATNRGGTVAVAMLVVSC